MNRSRLSRVALRSPLSPLSTTAALVAAVAASVFPAHARSDRPEVAKIETRFVQAAHLYDEGRFAEAANLYAGLAEQGVVSAELLYNLGNAYFRNGQHGLAVLSFRRAGYLAPRDPDVAANLRFAQQTTGGLEPFFAPPLRSLMRLSRAEWAVLTTVAYWFLFALLGASAATSRWRPVLLRCAGASAAMLALSLAGFGTWVNLERRPEAVVMAGGQQALYAPLDGSTAHFALPPGSIVRLAERSGDWIKVERGGKSGWVRGANCAVLASPCR